MRSSSGRLLAAALAVAVSGSFGGAPAGAAAIAATASAASAITATASAAPANAASAITATATPAIAQLIGQKMVVRIEGLTPSPALLGRIERGEVGGVILFGANITTATALRHLTAKLHAAAVAGHQPRLLIAVDQEGGSVKRIPWIPPTLSPPQMGALGSSTTSRSQGAATGQALRDLGIDVDLAPVADVPSSTASFMDRAGRTWSFDAARTARLASQFALGLRAGGVIPTVKHFPGIGFATQNTDTNLVRIWATPTQLAPGLAPYRSAIADHLPLIMLSNATYPAYDPIHGASWAPTIVRTLLRQDLGYTGATISDSLDGTAFVRRVAVRSIAAAAAKAGTDLILTTGTEAATAAVYQYLVAQATAGAILKSTLVASWTRIQALKATLPAA